jgi:hypothetical protein
MPSTTASTDLVIVPRAELRELIASAVAEALSEHHHAAAPAPDLVPGADMARRIGVSRTTMHRLRVAGCPAVRVGDTWRYAPADVVAWLRARGQR